MIDFLQNALFFIVPYALVLGLVVTIHELGHFLAAKSVGTKIDQFSLGFGKPLAQWTDKSGVQWRIGALPLGGYVRFAGDENAASMPDQDDLAAMRRQLVAREGEAALARYYHFKPLWQRAFITAAGPVANFLLGFVIFAGLLLAFGELVLPARVATLTPGGAAQVAGFRPGDLIVAADGRAIDGFDDLQQYVRVRAEVPITFTVRRDGHDVALTATPRATVIDDRVAGAEKMGLLGIVPPQARGDYVRVRYNPAQAAVGGVVRIGQMLSTTTYYLGRMITGHVSADQLRGPLGIATVTGKVAKLGAENAANVGQMIAGTALNLIQLAAIISVSIGFLNLMPIPVLDGGHLLFYAYEAVARRPLAAKVQAAGYRVGLALVLGLMLFATWNDLQRLRVFKLIGGLFS